MIARLLLFLASLGALPAMAAGAGETAVPAAVHVHSRASTGTRSVEDLAREAASKGLKAVFLAENHVGRVERGLWPFRRVLRVRRSIPSVLGTGPEAFLDEVRRARAAVPSVAIVPGLEILPHYRWTGGLLANDLAVHDLQKNLLVFGDLDAASIRDLPAIGSPGGEAFDPLRLGMLLAAAFLALAGGLAFRRSRRRSSATFEWEGKRFLAPGRRRRFPRAAVALLSLAALLAAEGAPPTGFRRSPYGPDPGDAPASEAIAWARARGLATAWSLPDARAEAVHPFPLGIRVREETAPYPGSVLATDADAFGAIVADTSHFADPGGPWDRLLAEAAAGRRRPCFAFGEASYHGGERGKPLDLIQTVLFPRSPGVAGLLEALREGRCYARQIGPDAALRLDRFRLAARGRSAEMGERLEGPADSDLALIVGGKPLPPRRVRLPVSIDETLAVRAPGWVRLEARAGNLRLLSNPIFIARASP